MRRSDHFLWFAFFCFSLSAGFFFGLTFVDARTSIVGWIERWQPLITGVLAVFAAWLTILQMSRVDAQQAERHRQLMSVSLRKDTLILDRYGADIVLQSRKLQELIQFLVVGIPEMIADPGSRKTPKLRDLLKLAPRNSPAFAEAEGLFSYEFVKHEKFISETFHDCRAAIHRFAIEDPFSIGRPRSWRIVESEAKELVQRLEAYANACRSFDEHVIYLHTKYLETTDMPLTPLRDRLSPLSTLP